MTIITRLSRATRLLSQDFRQTWKTPRLLYLQLDKEFHFDHDPCPPETGTRLNGIFSDWGNSNYVNPPYGAPIASWLAKGVKEMKKGKTSVYLLPAYTDVAWFHEIVLRYANEIRFVRGRLKFDDRPGNAPFASMIVIFSQELPSLLQHSDSQHRSSSS